MPGIAAIQGIPGGIAAQAQQDQGHLFVAPAYYQVASDQAVQLDAAADWIASKIVPECDFELTDIAWYVTAVATQGDMALEIYSHDATNNQPNASLAVIVAASDCGASADVWIQEALATAYQFYSGKTVWIVGKGTAGDDYSCSTRRWNTSQGSMFPDSMPETKVSTDSGSTWTAATQDSKPALWNIILNPNADGVPQLGYGRSSGKYAVTTAGLMETPEEAIFLDVSADTADTLYYVYLDTSGAISTSTTTWTKSNGMMVKSGDTSKKLIGIYYAQDALGGGDQAPIDVMDRRLIAYPGINKMFGKRCPYSSNTVEAISTTGTWFKWENNNDWTIETLCPNSELVARVHKGTDGGTYIAVGKNSVYPAIGSGVSMLYDNYITSSVGLIDNDSIGFKAFYPIINVDVAQNVEYYNATLLRQAQLIGSTWW